jgi:hypothetical protein
VENALDSVDRGADRAARTVEHGLERVADVVPEVLDTAVHVTTGGTRVAVGVFRNPKVLALAIVLLGAGAGVGLGYKIASIKLTKKFDARLESEIEQTRAFYDRKTKSGVFETPEGAAEALHVKAAVEALEDYTTPPGVEVVSDRPVGRREPKVRYDRISSHVEEDAGADVAAEESSNIFADGVPLGNFDLEREQAIRDAQPDVPYVISFDEYMTGKGYTQTSMTYYEKDDVLADENDIPIEEVEATVGNDNLSRFGHGSNDVNIVYVRNDRVELDIEIARSTGAFSEEVAGFIEHSEIPNRRRAGRGRRRDDGE